MKETARMFGRHRSLFGIVTEPSERVRGLPAVVILNSGIIHRVGPSRLAVSTARDLAARGHRVLRFDLSGIGDSARPREAGALGDVVLRDTIDAIDLVTDPDGEEGAGVVLMGLCSGADNALVVGRQDPRVRGLVLIDPTMHRTTGFHLRKIWARLLSARSWWNVLSGRSLLLRVRAQGQPAFQPPPEYYGLLTLGPEECREHVREMTQRGVRFLYILTGGIQNRCNYPEQVRDSMPGAFSDDNLVVGWRPEADHLLTRKQDREWMRARVRDFLAVGDPRPRSREPAAVTVPEATPTSPGADRSVTAAR